MSSPASPRRPSNDPMEDFLAREKAALEALEAVDIKESINENAMQIDEQPTITTTTTTTSSPKSIIHQNQTSPHQSPVASNLPTLTSTVNTINSNANVNSNNSSPRTMATSPTGSIRVGGGNNIDRQETEIMKQWKMERNSHIAEREAAAEQSRNERKEKATRELKQFREEWKTKMTQSETNKKKQVGNISVWDEEKPSKENLKKEQVEWNKAAELMEILPKPAKDCSRLVSIAKSLCNGNGNNNNNNAC